MTAAKAISVNCRIHKRSLTWQKKDEFSPIADLMKTLIYDFGVKFYVCAPCISHYGLDKAERVSNSEIKIGSFLGEMLLEREGLTF